MNLESLKEPLGERFADVDGKTVRLNQPAMVRNGATLVPLFYRSQTSVKEILRYGNQYLMICCCVCPGIFLEITFERILQSTGRTFYSPSKSS